MEDNVSPQLQSDKWQRLSPLAVLHYIAKFLTAIVKQGIQGLAPVAAVLFAAGENRWLVISLLAAAAILLLIVAAFLSYLKFRYRIGNDAFLIQSGVLTRKRLSLNFDRIQNVAIKEPIYFRPFDTVVLAIESAGSSASEVSLAGISRGLAQEIRAEVLAHKTAPVPSTSPDTSDYSEATSVEETTLIQQPIGELAKYGLSNNNVWVFAGIAAGASAQFEWWDYINPFDIRDLFGEYAETSLWLAGLASVATLLSFIVVLLSVSMIGSVIVYYDFRLSQFLDGRFHRTKGLFEKQETSLQQNKVQSLTIKQPWPALLLNRFNLSLNQVGFESAGQDGYQKSTPAFIVPSVQAGFLYRFARILYPEFEWSRLPLRGVSSRYTIKVVFFLILPIALIPATAISIQFGWVGLLPLLVPLLALPLVERYRRMIGYASDGKHGIMQTGFIGTRRTIIPFHKVQTVELVRSPGQRRYSLATIHIKMAGSKITLPYIPLSDAEQWRRDILLCIQSSKKAWM